VRLIRTGAVRRRTRLIVRAARSRLDDVIVIAGIGCITYGIGLVAVPAGWIFAGVALISVVALAGKRRS